MSVAITQSKVTEMGEMTLEADTINKFISSLGKSIQALCHGCMDFNNSIEMVGYININIDSGSFVDCVLNEKVQKSNANSMTCVSNSFHAKKDKPKQTKDASCSPVRRSDHGFEHPLSRRQHGFASRESGHRGSPRKRPRHFSKPGASSHDYYNSPANTYQGPSASNTYQEYSASNTYQEPSASNTYQEPSASNTYQEQSTSHSTEYSNPEQIVKTELQEGTSSDPAASSSSFDVSVKNETDATQLDTFSDSHEQNIQAGNSENESGENRTGEQSNEMDESSQNSVQESNSMGKTPVQDSGHEDSFLRYHDSQTASTHGQDYYNNREDNDDSQFEVIEIGDDDEDMQGFFDQPAWGNEDHEQYIDQDHPHPQQERTTPGGLWSTNNNHGVTSLTSGGHSLDSHPTPPTAPTTHSRNGFPPRSYPCSQCGSEFERQYYLKQHFIQYHSELLLSCHLCDKKFTSRSGRVHHLQSHKGRQYTCHVCDTAFNLKHHLKYHLKQLHQLKPCARCSNCFRMGDEFKEHVLQCNYV